MPKQLPIQISLPTPCSENWDEMTHQEQGRFCAHCQHTVIDFTTWSDTALYNFFSKENGRICGRFSPHQINRPINIPYQPHSRLYRIAIALGLTLMFTQTPGFAQTKPPVVQSSAPNTHNTDDGKKEPATENINGQLSGTIIDEKKEPLISAVVKLFNDTTEIAVALADFDGNYLIKDVPPGIYKLLVLYTGYDSLSVIKIPVRSGEKTVVNATMTRGIGTLKGDIMIHHPGFQLDRDNPTKRTYRRDELDKMR